MNFLDVFQRPFRAEDAYIYSANGVISLMAIYCDRYPEQLTSRTAQVLNGESKPKPGADIATDNGEIYINGTPVMVIRGWGHLTGRGGLALPEEEAAAIQDDFAQWVVGVLRGEIEVQPITNDV